MLQYLYFGTLPVETTSHNFLRHRVNICWPQVIVFQTNRPKIKQVLNSLCLNDCLCFPEQWVNMVITCTLDTFSLSVLQAPSNCRRILFRCFGKHWHWPPPKPGVSDSRPWGHVGHRPSRPGFWHLCPKHWRLGAVLETFSHLVPFTKLWNWSKVIRKLLLGHKCPESPLCLVPNQNQSIRYPRKHRSAVNFQFRNMRSGALCGTYQWCKQTQRPICLPLITDLLTAEWIGIAQVQRPCTFVRLFDCYTCHDCRYFCSFVWCKIPISCWMGNFKIFFTNPAPYNVSVYPACLSAELSVIPVP